MSDTSLTDLYADLSRTPEFAVHDMMDQVRYQLRRRMAETGTTQAALADAMGVKPPTVSRLLRAAENTSLLTVARAARALGLTFKTIKFVPDSEADLHVDEFGVLLKTEGTHQGWWSRTHKPGAYARRYAPHAFPIFSNPTVHDRTSPPVPSAFAFDDYVSDPSADLVDPLSAS